MTFISVNVLILTQKYHFLLNKCVLLMMSIGVVQAHTGQSCSDKASGLYRALQWPGDMLDICVEVQYAAFFLKTAGLCV